MCMISVPADANLLRKSKLSKTAGKNFKFHLNYKIIAKFKDSIDPEKGTILTFHTINKTSDAIHPKNTTIFRQLAIAWTAFTFFLIVRIRICAVQNVTAIVVVATTTDTMRYAA